MTTLGRAWKLYAYRYEGGLFHHVGERGWVALHQLPHPLVPVLVEEILGDLYTDAITHYGWQYVEGSRYRHGDAPTMIQIRAGSDPKDPKRALMLLDMCFAYGLAAEIKNGDGDVVALRITERKEDA